MNLATAVATIVSALIVPFLTALFTDVNMRPSVKRGIALAVSLVLALVVAVATNQIHVSDGLSEFLSRVVVYVGIVAALGQGYYRLFRDQVKNFEAATTFTDDREV